ncbi:very short patch repair endonuclease [Desulfonema magnum]|uniref:Very short patch repair endonucleases n=1 Tax=Desulfonema magnum TaxID=45655 RepID=A0A975BKD9_9BACT|nr:very short patch repair endonuclease [Desulfonema magnum]QTA87050.1 Very short patch repair endonucleases [Desulfonema magnum]
MTKRRLTRSENMARIRSRDTKPEIRLRQALWAAGCRYRLRSDLPGSPDILFVKARLAVFVDGCFWHGCPMHYSAPNTRQEFWKTKLRKNVLRDMAADDALISDNWEVLRIWEHELKDTEEVVRRIQNLLGAEAAIYRTDAISVPANVSEAVTGYGSPQDTNTASFPWWTCDCGSTDVCVLSVSGPGSLRPNSQRRPEYAELVCRKCRKTWTVSVPDPGSDNI